MQVVSLRDTVPIGTRGTEWARRAFAHLELDEDQKDSFVAQVVGTDDEHAYDGTFYTSPSRRQLRDVAPSPSKSQKQLQFSKANLSSSSSRFGMHRSSSEPLVVPPPRWPSDAHAAAAGPGIRPAGRSEPITQLTPRTLAKCEARLSSYVEMHRFARAEAMSESCPAFNNTLASAPSPIVRARMAQGGSMRGEARAMGDGDDDASAAREGGGWGSLMKDGGRRGDDEEEEPTQLDALRELLATGQAQAQVQGQVHQGQGADEAANRAAASPHRPSSLMIGPSPTLRAAMPSLTSSASAGHQLARGCSHASLTPGFTPSQHASPSAIRRVSVGRRPSFAEPPSTIPTRAPRRSHESSGGGEGFGFSTYCSDDESEDLEDEEVLRAKAGRSNPAQQSSHFTIELSRKSTVAASSLTAAALAAREFAERASPVTQQQQQQQQQQQLAVEVGGEGGGGPTAPALMSDGDALAVLRQARVCSSLDDHELQVSSGRDRVGMLLRLCLRV